MARFDFKIGTSGTAGLVNVELLPVPCLVGVWRYKPYQRVVELGDLSARGLGVAEVTWRMSVMSRAQRDQFRVYCPDASSEVYIRTRKNDTSAYVNMRVKMLWPIEEDHQTGRVLDTIFKFLVLQEY